MSKPHLSYALVLSIPKLIFYLAGAALSLVRLEKNKTRYTFAALGFCTLFLLTIIALLIEFEFNQDGAFGAYTGAVSHAPDIFMLYYYPFSVAAHMALAVAIFIKEEPIPHQDVA